MNREDQPSDAVASLRRLVAGLPPSPIRELKVVKDVLVALASAWDSFAGSTMSRMKPHKLSRAENLVWQPPLLTFEIERHGAVKFGSKYAEKQQWSVDFDTLTTEPVSIGRKLIEPRNARLNVDPLVEKVCDAVIHGDKSTSFIKWRSDSEFLLSLKELVPDDAPKQTVTGRRKTLRSKLFPKLEEAGWFLVSGSRYRFQRHVR